MAFPMTRGTSSGIAGPRKGRYLYGATRGARLGGLGDDAPATDWLTSLTQGLQSTVKAVTAVTQTSLLTGQQIAATVKAANQAFSAPKSAVPAVMPQPTYGGIIPAGSSNTMMWIIGGLGLAGAIAFVAMRR